MPLIAGMLTGRTGSPPDALNIFTPTIMMIIAELEMGRDMK